MSSVISTGTFRGCGKTGNIIWPNDTVRWGAEDIGATDGILIADDCVFISAGEFADIAYEPEPLPKLSPFHQTRQARGKGKCRRDWEK